MGFSDDELMEEIHTIIAAATSCCESACDISWYKPEEDRNPIGKSLCSALDQYDPNVIFFVMGDGRSLEGCNSLVSLTRQIRAHEPLVIIAPFASAAETAACIEAGATNVWTRPFDLAEIASSFSAWFRGSTNATGATDDRRVAVGR